MVNQTLRSRRSQIELKRKFLAKGCPCCTILAAFLSSGRISMFGLWNLSRFVSKPSTFLVAGTSDESLSSLFSSWLRSSSELRSLDDELDKLLSSLELRLLDEELDKDDEDEDSFENLEE